VRLKPGPGWKKVGNLVPVWDHASGVRIHAWGLCRLPDGSTFFGNRWPEGRDWDRAIREQGGNRRRGTMVWALRLAIVKGEK
jgi:hypothetical protein